MDPYINLKEGRRDSETFMDPYKNVKEGQGDPETSWAPIYI